MNVKEQLIFIANNIMPLEDKHDCHIFVSYSPHVENMFFMVYPFKWADGSSISELWSCYGDAIKYLPEKIESYIIEAKSNAKSSVQKRLEEIEKEKESLLKQMEEV